MALVIFYAPVLFGLLAEFNNLEIREIINNSRHTYEAVKDQFNCVHRGNWRQETKGR